MALPERPARLDIRDLPRDPDRSMSTLNRALVATFNYCRQYPAKLTLLENTLRFMATKIKEYRAQERVYQKALAQAAEAERAAQAALDTQG